jgi:hypothetical protein
MTKTDKMHQNCPKTESSAPAKSQTLSSSTQPEAFVGEIPCNEQGDKIQPPWNRPAFHCNLPADEESQEMKQGDDEKKNSGRNDITFPAHVPVGYSRRGDSVNLPSKQFYKF